MSNLTDTFQSTIGKKLIVGLTGLFLVLFLIEHLTGNMLLIFSPEAFAAYAHFMGTFFIVRILEVGLFAAFIAHIVTALKVNLRNDGARPKKYAVNASSKNSSFYSQFMRASGLVMLVFLILHLVNFFAFARFGVDVDFTGNSIGAAGEAMGMDHEVILMTKVAMHFSKGWYVLLYVAAMVFIGIHLNHGFQSAFQTLGWNHKKYTPLIKKTGTAFAIVIPAAYAAIPIYFAVDAMQYGRFAFI